MAANRVLKDYRRKRDFRKTLEPPPGPLRKRKPGLLYVIQKHDATRLHYDFRLELDGVLLSWAVPKGPALDPAEKRLAVRTEDHPISYGGFEGSIPKGQYGGGTVTLWDRGTWEPKGDPKTGLKKGHLPFTLHGKRLKGGWSLVRMRGDDKRENWLLIKEKDDIAEGVRGKAAVARSDDNLRALTKRYSEVQLATLVDKPPEGEQWLHEIKFDGYRLLGFVSGDALLRTRNGQDWTRKFPSLVDGLEELKVRSAVLDMEAVVIDADGKSSFQSLQKALGDGGDAREIVAYVFDLLYLDGEDLTGLPLTGRKEKLQALLKKLGPRKALRFSDHQAGRGGKMFAEACGKRLEGIVSKLADAPYAPGRQKSWVKSKCSDRQEFVILGYSAARKGERALGTLYLGYRKDDGELKYAGKVGTGFSMQSARELVARFAPIAVRKAVLTSAEMRGTPTPEYRSIQWVQPVLLCEIAFTEWTEDGRIRHPSFRGLREDKNARDVQKETPEPAPAKAKAGSLTVAGIAITHPQRVIAEPGHITKGDLAEYYAGIAPFILPRIVRRPISLLRCPTGIEGECFFQRDPGKGLGPDIRPFDVRHGGRKLRYLYIEDEKGLLEAVQMGVIEIHPWGARIDAIDNPDRLVFDLDPSPEVPFGAVKQAAQNLRQRLEDRGIESVLKCTGGKGLHLIAPLAATQTWRVAKEFAASVAEEMVAAAPEAYVATMSKAKRAGKVFIDYFRNDYSATAIADYSVRARPGAPVAVPLEWAELKGLKSASAFTMKEVFKRLERTKEDAFSRLKPQKLPAA